MSGVEGRTLYGTKYIARRLKVSTNVVYWWMSQSQAERSTPGAWGRTPCPVATVEIRHAESDRPVKVWTEDQIPEWDAWYADYKSSKTKKI